MRIPIEVNGYFLGYFDVKTGCIYDKAEPTPWYVDLLFNFEYKIIRLIDKIRGIWEK